MMLLRHLLSILALPFTVTVIVPALLLDGFRAPPVTVARGTAAIILMLAGLTLFVSTVWNFATRGRGTLAPWDPPRRLVVSGIYRFVRNPMITGVLLILLAETVFFAARSIALWSLAFFAVNAVYIPLIEERALVRRFGDDYNEYRRNVPRWIPRLSAWRG